jgi:cyclophilin family peptidyl-prolyl cis-trans isomerase/HEAT repeat protein
METLIALVACQVLACSSTPEREEAEVPTENTQEIARFEIERRAASAFAPFISADSSVADRRRAALALARIERIDAAQALLALLIDEDAIARTHAAFGLGQIDLVLVANNPAHGELRERVESALAARARQETDTLARRAMVRALGRVARGSGRTVLLELASADGPFRADALEAIGVGGARAPWPTSTPDLAATIQGALRHKDPTVRRAASYAVFRQSDLDRDRIATLALVDETDPEATIHLLRALSRTVSAAHARLVNPDWRVQVEAIRAMTRGTTPLPVDELVAFLDQQTSLLAEVPNGAGTAHTVLAACDALVNAPRERTVAVLDDVVNRLRTVHSRASCACAVARDAQEVKVDAIARCGEGTSDEERRLLEVKMVARAHIAVDEQVGLLAPFLTDPSVPVRMAAANALVDHPGSSSSMLASTRLSVETDAAVAGALLGVLEADGAHHIPASLLRTVVDRFHTVTRFEDAEPLLAALRLSSRLRALDVDPLRDFLRAHAIPQVRVAASGVPFGERDPYPLARLDVTPSTRVNATARVETERGTFRIALDATLAPYAVANFITLAENGAHARTGFHRVVADFVIQGGDPRGDGSGGPGYTIPCENSDAPFATGVVGMALAGKDTGGSQFFVTHSPQPHLDGRYTVFGRVTEGQEVVDAIVEGDRILAVHIDG